MSPEFANAVDPVLLYVIQLLERTRSGDELSASDEQVRIIARIDEAEAKMGDRDDWQLAKYALACWVDEVLITDAPWQKEHQNWWENNTLEFKYFKSRERYQFFYHQAEKASGLKKKDALEVFYICVVLGFRGIYRDAAGNQQAAKIGLPESLEKWAKRAASQIRWGQGRPPMSGIPRVGRGAPPRMGKYHLLGNALAFLCLAAAALVLALFLYSR